MGKAFLLLLAGAVSGSPVAWAAGDGAEFSAEAVQGDPRGGQAMTAKMHVGADGMRRMEFTQNNQRVVQIMRPQQGVMWILFPDQGTYMERRMPPTLSEDEATGNPCAGRPNMTCRSLGVEQISGRAAEKWEVESSYQGQTLKMLEWVDKERGMPMRRESPDGAKMELNFQGNENVNGRDTENWELVSVSPKGETSRAHQWYDPRLRMAVKEEMPGGGNRELRNIQEGPQAASLFEIPQGYRLIEPQQQRGYGQGQQGGMPRR